MLDWGKVDPEELKPDFRAAVERVLAPLAATWLVTHGLRSSEEQAALYRTYKAGGPKAAPPGLSPHEYGLAVDVVLRTGPKQVSWDTELFAAEWNAMWEAVDESPDLHSGRFFRDGDHIERTKWRAHT